MEQKKSLIQSLDRALDILELVRDSSIPMRSSDIAEKMELRVATASNILRSLFQRGYLAQDENSRYLLGPECFKLFRGASDSFEELRQLVKEPVKELAEDTGDTTFFGSEYFGALYCAALTVGGGQLVVANPQNWLELLHCTAAGKIIIAEKGIEWYERLCQKQTPQKLTSRTITDIEGMKKEIDKIRRDGYSVSLGECSDEIAAIGIAVYDHSGKFIGSLAQSIPSVYIESGKIDPAERAELLKKYAEKIK